jgi:hypothetical protein
MIRSLDGAEQHSAEQWQREQTLSRTPSRKILLHPWSGTNVLESPVGNWTGYDFLNSGEQ